MAEVFFSYSSRDRERVRPFYEALAALGFDVFWDQAVPAGTDWDTWIKDKLTASRSAVVFWSLASIASDNVRHEATVAKNQGKLVPVLLDDLRVEQFPMGLFTTQAAHLTKWSGKNEDPEWQKLLAEIEGKATPHWLQRRLALHHAELSAEQKRREAAQAKEDAAEAQLAKEIAGQGQLRRERDQALTAAQVANAELTGLRKALNEAEVSKAELVGVVDALRAAGRQTAGLQERLAKVERRSVWLAGGLSARALISGTVALLVVGVGGYALFSTQWGQSGEFVAKKNMSLIVPIERAFLVRVLDSTQGCLALCLERTECKAFDFVRLSNKCYLYSERYSLERNTAADAGLRP